MPKYRKPTADLVTFTDRVSQRVAKLERMPRGVATSIDRGSLQFNGGELIINPGNSGSELPFLLVTAKPTTLTNWLVIDNYDRNISSSWGTQFDVLGEGYSFAIADWIATGGSASDYNVTYSGTDHKGIGTISVNTLNAARSVVNGASAVTDQAVRTTFSIPALPTGAPVTVGAVLRVGTYGNYQVRALIQTNGSVVFNIVNNQVLPTAVDTVLANVTVPNFTLIAGQKYTIYAEVVDFTINAKIYLADTSQPRTQVTYTDTTSTYPRGTSAVRVRVETGNTNTLPYVFSFYNTQMICNTNQIGINSIQPDNVFTLYRHDSSANGLSGLPGFIFTDLPYDPDVPASTITISDRWSDTIFSDATKGRGIGSPTIPTRFFDPAATKSTTSGSFTNFASAFWHVYHPKLRVTCLINVPSGTTYEVRVNENGHDQQAITSVTNYFGYIDLIVDREATVVGSGDFSNGQEVNLDLEWRRSAGSGTATMVFVDAMGMDI